MRRLFLFCLIVAGFNLPHPANARQADAPIQIDLTYTSDDISLDPTLVVGGDGFNLVENLFMGLTGHDPKTGQILPKLATEWAVSEDGLTWTFTLRQDVNWVFWADGEILIERPVVAGDFMYGIKRACGPDPLPESPLGFYGGVLARVIAGCDVVRNALLAEASRELIFGDTTQVSAPDDATLVIQLQTPAAYFLSLTALPIMRPLAAEVVESGEPDWWLPDTTLTNGVMVLSEFERGVRRVMARNTTLPADLQPDGNADLVVFTFIPDVATIFDLFVQRQLDRAPRPAGTADADIPADVKRLNLYDQSVHYFSYDYTQPPFDVVEVRRAFSAVIDREAFVTSVEGVRGDPMIHFTPPTMQHAPALDTIGVGFDTDYAQNQLAAGGYPNCENFPPVTLLTYTGTVAWAEFWVVAIAEHLGCDPALFTIEEVELADLQARTAPDADPATRPQLFTSGWSPEYPDAQNFMNVLYCDNPVNRTGRGCNATDELINQAATNYDPGTRTALYGQIEEAFFGPEGEFPIVPLYRRANIALVQSWYEGPFEEDGVIGLHWGFYEIDQAAKDAARGN